MPHKRPPSEDRATSDRSVLNAATHNPDALRWSALADWLVFLPLFIGTALTFQIAVHSAARNQLKLAEAVQSEGLRSFESLVDRMKGFERGIRGTRGAVLVGGQENMMPETYRLYSESRDAKTEFPGARGFGFIVHGAEKDLVRFVSPSRGHEELNALIGMDIGRDAELRTTAFASMDSGAASMTSAHLLSEPALILLPIYAPNRSRSTTEQRTSATIGWAFGAVDINAVAGSIGIANDLQIQVREVLDSAASLPVVTMGGVSADPIAGPAALPSANVYGRRWQATVIAGPHFASQLNLLDPADILRVGSLLSLLLWALVSALASYWKRSREVLANEQLLASVVANASDAIIIESLRGDILSWNAAAERLFGYSAEFAVGKRVTDILLNAETAHEDLDILAKCAAGVSVPAYEAVRRHADGRLIDVTLSAAPVEFGGKVVSAAKTIRDNSVRKALDQSLRQNLMNLEFEVERRTESLRAAERDLRAITDSLPSLIAYWDKNLINKFANKAYQQWYGVDEDKLAGKPLHEWFDSEMVKHVMPWVERVMRGESVSYERERQGEDNDAPRTLQVHYLPDKAGDEVRGFYVLAHDISAIKATQTKLAASERFLEQAGIVSGVGGFQVDLRSGSQSWTRQTFRIYEIDGDVAPSAEELDKLMAPQDGARLWGAIRVAAESGEGYDLEIPTRTTRGRPIWIRTIGIVEFDEKGPARVVGAIQDITERKEAERQLRVVNDRFSVAADAAGIGVWEWDLVSNVLIWDEQMHRLYGREASAPESGYALWCSSLHPDDRIRAEREINEAVRGAKQFDTEFRIRLPDGAVRHMKTAAKVQRDTEGRPMRMVGVTFDISGQKAAEQSVLDSESKFRTLFELSPVGIALNDLKTGAFLTMNAALVEPTGYSAKELLALTYKDLTPGRFRDQDAAALSILKEADGYGPYEKEYVRKDGSTYPILMSGIRTKDPTGRDVIWSIVQDISLRKAMELQLADAARRDKLTGLANRGLFMERLDKAIARVAQGRQSLFAVLFLDFDRFKLVNDTLGHEAGDELLRQIALRLKSVLRASDGLAVDDDGGNVVGRFGGDEFLLLINDLKSPSGATAIAERSLNALSPTYDIHGTEVHSSASIGIVVSDRGQTTSDEVVRNADVAMFEAKRAGRACYVQFNDDMHARLTRHMTIESGLRRALEAHELYLEYQPIIDLNTGSMASVEALVRWRHPVLGLISPSEFIPIAEESSLIVAIGQWVQQQACEAMVQWRREDPERAPATVSVNVSRAELALGDRLLNQIRDKLAKLGLPAHCLQLEVTEREVMRHPESSLALMTELRTLGVKLAMDDFGTGTSSLGVLRHYPFDTIKVDRSFVQDVSSNSDVMAVMHATINLIENLGMTSVAEGVEEPTQIAILQSMGCHYAQGYLFSKAVAPSALLRSVASRNWLRRNEETAS